MAAESPQQPDITYRIAELTHVFGIDGAGKTETETIGCR